MKTEEDCQRFTFATGSQLKMSQWNGQLTFPHIHKEALHTQQCNHGIVGRERRCGGEQCNVAAGMLQTTLSLSESEMYQLCWIHQMTTAWCGVSSFTSPCSPTKWSTSAMWSLQTSARPVSASVLVLLTWDFCSGMEASGRRLPCLSWC